MTHTDDEKALDRRRFLKCMAWVGTGAVWTMSSGVLSGSPLGAMHRGAGLRFVQISDSHIGFDKPANTDVTATLRAAIATWRSERWSSRALWTYRFALLLAATGIAVTGHLGGLLVWGADFLRP